MNEPKPMNEHCRLEHSDWNYLERSEDELCPVCRGEQEATKRIIKLLKKLDNHGMTHSELCARTHYFVQNAIALIKEKK